MGRGLYELGRFTTRCGCEAVVQGFSAQLISQWPMNSAMSAVAVSVGPTVFVIHSGGVMDVSGGGYTGGPLGPPSADYRPTQQIGDVVVSVETRRIRGVLAYAWRLHFPGGGSLLVIRLQNHRMPGGEIYYAWLTIPKSTLSSADGLCSGSCRGFPYLPFSRCGEDLPQEEFCYPVNTDASLFPPSVLLQLETDARLDPGTSTRHCSSNDPPSAPSSPSLPPPPPPSPPAPPTPPPPPSSPPTPRDCTRQNILFDFAGSCAASGGAYHSNLGGVGPDSGTPEEIRYRSIATYQSESLDLVVTLASAAPPPSPVGFYAGTDYLGANCRQICAYHGLTCTGGAYSSKNWHSLIDSTSEAQSLFVSTGLIEDVSECSAWQSRGNIESPQVNIE